MAHEGHPVLLYALPEFPTGVVGPAVFNIPYVDVGDICTLGFITGNIVEVEDRGAISGTEMVTLVHDSTRWDTRDAIIAFNRLGVEVGVLERRVSIVLAKLLEAGLVTIEGIVPIVTRRDAKFIPVQIHVFASRENVDEVYGELNWGGLELIRTDESVAVAVEKSRGGTMEVMEAPKQVVKSELFVHQKEALAWMVKRESSCELPPFWVEKGDGTFYNEVMRVTVAHRPQPLRGGIFADDMGMGKTLTLISLIALDKYCGYVDGSSGSGSGSGSGSDVVEEDDDGEFAIYGGRDPKTGRGTKMVNRLRKRQRVVMGYQLDNQGRHEINFVDVVASRTTLVVSSPSVFSTWKEQLEKHTRPGKLNVYLYYGQRTDDPMELAKYDVVLTTYSLLGSELSSKSGMFRVSWWRVILDEAHMIKNPNAQQTIAVLWLNATRRWLVTGTPIQNNALDLFSFMLFLRYQPFPDRHSWKKSLLKQVEIGSESTRLQVVMEAICLRRTKDKGIPGLPQKIMKICYVDLSAEERELYDRMEVEAKTVLRDYISADTVTNNYTAVLSIILRLRQICTHIDLCPKDLIGSLPSSNIKDLSNNPDLLKKMVAILDVGEDFDCPICISPPTDIVITRCAHIYCKSCILKTLGRGKRRCPLCRHDLSESDIFSAPEEKNYNAKFYSGKSSKISALLELLSAARVQDPTAKSVVFSQFRKMLILLEEPLKNAGFKVLRMDGSINANKRAGVIKDFGVPAPNGPTVLLASLRASCTGVNLTAANTVYLLEPWWNPAVDEQAMDRVHRIGQTKEVTIIRLIARNSIEERILELQDKKKRMASRAWGRKAGPTVGKINTNDIRTLVSLTDESAHT